MIRFGTAEDEQVIHDLCLSFIKESPYTSFTVSEQQVREKVRHFLTVAPKEHSLFVWEQDEQVVGFIAGMITSEQNMFSADKTALELAWFIHPDHRKGMGGIRLLKAYEWWAKSMNCKHVALSNLTTKYTDKLSSLYSKLGYSLVEQSFLKDL